MVDYLDAPVASLGRAAWLRRAADDLQPYFVDRGVAFPPRLRFAPHPFGRPMPNTLGLCHHGQRRIWIAFERCADTAQVLVVLVHELLHLVAIADRGDAHGKTFAHAAARIDLHRSKDGIYIAPGPTLALAVRVLQTRLPPIPVDWVGPRPVRSPYDPRHWR